MVNQINIFLLLFGALQGALLSLWAFRNQRRRLANTYFALFLTVIGLQLVFKVITKAWLMDHASLPYNLSYNFPYLIGPLLYLYIKSRKENVFKKTDLLHFLPFGISLLGVLMAMLFWVFILQFSSFVTAGLQIISLSVYVWLSLRLGGKGLKTFILSVAAAEILIAITLALMHKFYPSFPDVRLLFIVLTVLVYWISFKAISKPDFFIEVEGSPIVAFGFSKNTKYAHSSLKETEAARIESDLQQSMQRDQLYLDSALTIDVLASKLNTTRHHLSQVLNERIKRSYGDYVTDLRLEESRKRLSSRANYRFTIAAIALDSGFNSVSSFNDVFKKRYGITPSKFREQHLNKMSA